MSVENTYDDGSRRCKSMAPWRCGSPRIRRRRRKPAYKWGWGGGRRRRPYHIVRCLRGGHHERMISRATAHGRTCACMWVFCLLIVANLMVGVRPWPPRGDLKGRAGMYVKIGTVKGRLLYRTTSR
ncbi:hypothetical protein BHE74_00018460 [Ensete ventricosum]|nr:hypothetical protein BHE74_00018460 [Ensete ventricosum]